MRWLHSAEAIIFGLYFVVFSRYAAHLTAEFQRKVWGTKIPDWSERIYMRWGFFVIGLFFVIFNLWNMLTRFSPDKTG